MGTGGSKADFSQSPFDLWNQTPYTCPSESKYFFEPRFLHPKSLKVLIPDAKDPEVPTFPSEDSQPVRQKASAISYFLGLQPGDWE